MPKGVGARLAALETAITELPASTRAIAVMRIGLPVLAWAEMGDQITIAAAGPLLTVAFYSATVSMFIGFYSQLATFLTAFSIWWAMQRVPDTGHHHTVIHAMATTCLALTPCGKSFSLDRLISVQDARREGRPIPAEQGNLWAVRLICLQLSALFFWGAYNKLTLGTQSFQTAFLSGDRLAQSLVYHYSVRPPWPGWVESGFAILATGVTAFELFAGFGLWIPRVRKWVLLGCLMMTSSFQIILSVRTFGFLTALLYLSFIPPEKVHRVIDRIFEK